VTDIAPGWYPDPADPATQRYWDGEGYLGEPLPATATTPPGPPPAAPATTAAPDPAGPSLTGQPVGPDQVAAPSSPAPLEPTAAGPVPVPPAGPAPRPHGLVIASPGARLLARLIDLAAIAALCAVANAWFAYQWWQAFVPYFRAVMNAQLTGGVTPDPPASASNLLPMMCAVATAVWFAYEVPGSANSGQTLGKRLLRIKIVRIESPDRLGFGRAFRRWGRLGLPTLLWWCYGVGFLIQFFDCLFVALDRPLHQALHDKSAGTVVVVLPGTKRPARVGESSSGGGHVDPR
jgi:uncharacterized RDD family membrane protein YckC